MKVIVAGFSKTGTKTLNAALTELGYEVYDFLEHFWHHGKNWSKILKHGGTVDDFKRMYKDVDAVCDIPACAFWEEIHEAFPDSKIILTERDEAPLVNSLYEQLQRMNEPSLLIRLITITCPTSRKLLQLSQKFIPYCFGMPFTSSFQTVLPNKLMLKRRYREHNCYVKENAPKDKLLVFKVQEGWDPLCKFLEKEVPDKPFPWRNKNGCDIEPLIWQHEYKKKVQNELVVICSFVVLLAAVLICFLW